MNEYPEAPSIRFTRRELLRQSALATLAVGGLPALLAACGGGTGTTPAGDSAGADGASGAIDFYSWQATTCPSRR
jgi:hypothetical protein